jgi:hypothetical protein
MANPARALAKQFVRRSPTTLLGVGVILSTVDFVCLYTAAAKEGVLRVDQGVGLLNHYGIFSMILGNAISLYAAKKYFDGVCSIKVSLAVTDGVVVEEPLNDLMAMVELRGKYKRIMYLFLILGTLFWASNFAIDAFGDPVAKWGRTLDTWDHPWSFAAGRFHNILSWIIIMPFVVHVMICSSIQLRRAMSKASAKRALVYDLLNPDRHGGFAFVDKSLLAFNIVAALVYVEVTMHMLTFGRLNLEHIIDYIILTLLLVVINRMFFAKIYAIVKKLRFQALNKVKDEVFENNKLSFEVLKYCYERRVSTLSIASFLVQASAIVIPGIVKYWPVVMKAITRVGGT